MQSSAPKLKTKSFFSLPLTIPIVLNPICFAIYRAIDPVDPAALDTQNVFYLSEVGI